VLAELVSMTERTRRGSGGCTIVEGAWGTGRSALLSTAVDTAAAAGLTVVRAVGTSLETDLAWGVAAQLLTPARTGAQLGAPTDPPPSTDPEQLCRSYLAAIGSAPHGPAANVAQLARGLALAIERLARAGGDPAAGGLLVAVDDLHRVDGESLRVLAHLAALARRAPVCLVLSTVAGAPLQAARAATALAAASDRLTVAELSDEGVRELVARRLPHADPRLASVCATVTGGNPALLRGMLDALGDGASPPGADGRLAAIPEPIRRSVAERLAELTAEQRRVIQTVAVLGGEATVPRVAGLAGVGEDAVLTAATTLAALGLLSPRLPLAVVPPLVATALRESIEPFDRARAHLGAARILRVQQADPATIAEHLLIAPASEDPGMIPPLRDTAHRAAEDNDLERAALLLSRALEERPDDGLRLRLMTDLAWVQAGTRELIDPGRLRALHRSDLPPVPRGALALAMGRALYAHRRPAEALPILATGVELLERHDPELHAATLAARVICASLIEEHVPTALADRRQLLRAPPDRLGVSTRAAIAHTVIRDVLGGAPRARVRDLTELAWGEGRLLESGPFLRLGAPLLCAALVLVDELERAIEIMDAIRDAPRTPWIAEADSALTAVRAWARFLQGDINSALRGAIETLGATEPLGRLTTIAAQALAAACGLESGRVKAAERVLAEARPPPPEDRFGQVVWHLVRSQVRLANHRPQEALQDALDAGQAARMAAGETGDGLIAWRSAAALALLALGDREQAEALTREELRQTGELGHQRAMIGGLMILGLALPGDGLAALQRAVEVGDLCGPRLASVKALVELGAALRRANRRVQAREPLRRGLDLSHHGGARRIEARARAELTAAGARPRRAATTGVASLTASQSRVAELAAGGLTTRQIADALFVTPKTVEFHLRHAYRKLDVNSRADLSRALERA
jgi:DNA-binding CsgD family transcriptional regulator